MSLIDNAFCVPCKKTYATKQSLQSHSKLHRERLRQTCPTCGMKVLKLDKHLLTHLDRSKRTTFTCEQCNSEFIQRGNLKIHMSTVHGSFPCTICKDTLPTKKVLRSHLHHHKLEVKHRFKCTECDAKYTTNQNLKRHMARLHS